MFRPVASTNPRPPIRELEAHPVNLYNENPTWLQDAHRELDEAVFAAYGWPNNLIDQDILTRLLQFNTGRSRPPI